MPKDKVLINPFNPDLEFLLCQLPFCHVALSTRRNGIARDVALMPVKAVDAIVRIAAVVFSFPVNHRRRLPAIVARARRQRQKLFKGQSPRNLSVLCPALRLAEKDPSRSDAFWLAIPRIFPQQAATRSGLIMYQIGSIHRLLLAARTLHQPPAAFTMQAFCRFRVFCRFFIRQGANHRQMISRKPRQIKHHSLPPGHIVMNFIRASNEFFVRRSETENASAIAT